MSEKQLAAPKHLVHSCLKVCHFQTRSSELGNFTATVGQSLFRVDCNKRVLSQLQAGMTSLSNGSQNSDALVSPGGLIKKCRVLDPSPIIPIQ